MLQMHSVQGLCEEHSGAQEACKAAGRARDRGLHGTHCLPCRQLIFQEDFCAWSPIQVYRTCMTGEKSSSKVVPYALQNFQKICCMTRACCPSIETHESYNLYWTRWILVADLCLTFKTESSHLLSVCFCIQQISKHSYTLKQAL